MKKIIALFCVMVMIFSIGAMVYADPGQSLEEAIKNQETTEEDTIISDNENDNNENEISTVLENNDNSVVVDDKSEVVTGTTENQDNSEDKNNENTKSNSDFINGLNEASNLVEPDIVGANEIIEGVRTVAAWIVQVLSYVIIAFMSVKVLLDLTYIAIPFTRTFLANGYVGQAQASTQTPMSGGLYGNNGMTGRSPMMNGGMYSRGSMMNGMNQMTGQNAMINQNSSRIGNIQFVSNAALHAVATESTVGADGKTMSPFKIYVKDMIVTLVLVPVLIVLAATGVLTQFGFAVADLLVRLIQSAAQKIA